MTDSSASFEPESPSLLSAAGEEPTSRHKTSRAEEHSVEVTTPLSKKPRNAFSELMRRKPPTAPLAPALSSKLGAPFFRFVLEPYIKSPASQPPNAVIYHNDDWVLINDKFPKSQIHCLLIPRNLSISKLHPCTALSDSEFLAAAKEEVKRAKGIVVAEARRRWGAVSEQEKARREAMEKLLESADEIDDDPKMTPAERQAKFEAQLPPGRDWESEVMVGVHSHPSLYNVHIHILTRDRISEKMKHRKHYNSMATKFFVDLDEFPLPEDERRGEKRGPYIHGDLKCWRCGKNFGSQFAKLKRHLEEEYEIWKRL